MQHHASLVSNDSGDEVEVAIDIGMGRVEMFVQETSVGRWPVAAFVAAPDGDGGFQLQVDGERWTIVPTDHALFLADALPRTRLLSRARLVNRYPRLVAAADMLLDPVGRRRLAWYGLVVVLSIISFAFGAIAGRYRIEGRNLLTWVLVGLLVLTSVTITRFVVHQASGQTKYRSVRWASEPVDHQSSAPAVSRLLATLDFQAPAPAPEAELVTEPEPVERGAEAETDGADLVPVPPTAPDIDEDEPILEHVALESVPDDDDDDRDASAIETTKTEDESAASVAESTPEPVDREQRDDAPAGIPTDPMDPAANGRIPVSTGQSDTPGSRIVVINIDRDPDDLTTIHGIGETYAAILADLGITTYQQLAAIDGPTLEALRGRMGSFSGRIEREQWIEHAAESHRAKWARPHTGASEITDSPAIS